MPDAFPLRDPVGSAEPVSVPGLEVVAHVVAPGAERADAEGVPRSTLDALAEAGLLGTPLQPPAAQRELTEQLAGADASTWFCWTQHQSPLRTLEQSDNAALQAELLPGLRDGTLLAGVAFAHVRRPGVPNPVATRLAGGWRLEGSLDWVTSWDIADVVMVMARGSGADAGRLVCAYLPAGRSGEQLTGLRVGPPLRLLAMSGTHTRPVRLDGVVVPDARVGAVLDAEAWRATDERMSASAGPAAFGVARAAVAELDLLAEERGDARLRAVADMLVGEVRATRDRAYASYGDDVSTQERLHARAASLDLVVRATVAAVVARAGAAMRTGAATERRLREAMFLQVQAQTGATRGAMLDRMLAEGPRTA